MTGATALPLRAEAGGGGEPLVLLHGFTGSAASWREIGALLEPHACVIAPDLPGHGVAPRRLGEADYTLDATADALASLLDSLGHARAAVLGYSLGARVALRFALRHPSRVRALILESGTPGLEDETERVARRAADDELAAQLERDGTAAFVERWERLPMWASQRALPDDARQRQRRGRLASDAAGLAASLRGAGSAAEPSMWPRLRELAVPALFVAGALDEKYAVLARRMGERVPDARVEIVDGAGHNVHLERPAAFAAVVRRFLADAALRGDR